MLEQQKSYYENQAEKCGRISKYSLDSDNKRAYAKRAEVWQDKAEKAAERLDETVAKSEKSVIMKSRDVSGLEQAKKRDRKIEITDIAIDKITKSTVSEFSDVQNKLVDEVHKELLTKSKNCNNSNEVACIFDINSAEKVFQYGTEHSVNIFNNPTAFSMSNCANDNSLFLAHNHPSTQGFSYADLGVFLSNDSIVAMSVVSNTGHVRILYKSSGYSYTKALEKLLEIKKKLGEYSADIDLSIVKLFLKNSDKIGILQY